MHRHWKQFCFLAVLTSILLLIFSGCGDYENAVNSTEESRGQITLRLLVDDGFMSPYTAEKCQIETLIMSFENSHENVTVEVEVLDDDLEAREIQMQQLRVEIMAGQGPDLFLLPTVMNPAYLLFSDVNQAMHNGVFADISEWYDCDDSLGKEGLNAAVMDAGVVEGQRFVLPLRYTFPVVYYDKVKLAEAGLPETFFQGDAAVWMEALVATGNGRYGTELRLARNMLNYFPELFDYEKETVLLPRENLVSFLETCAAFEQFREVSPVFYINADYSGYYERSTWTDNGDLFWLGNLEHGINETVFAQANGTQLGMCPMMGADGKITAEIRMYGAVGAGCRHPELGYAFLREFLTVECQWEKNNSRGVSGGDLIGNGYTVRTADSAEDYYQVIVERGKNSDWSYQDPDGSRRAKLEAVEIHNEDFPIFAIQPDVVRFPAADLENDLAFGVSGIAAGTKTAEEVANEWLRSAMFHLAEG